LEALRRIWEQSRATVSRQSPQVAEDDGSKRSKDTTAPPKAETFQQQRQPTAPSSPRKVGNKSASRLQTGIPLKKPAIIPTSWKMGLIELVAMVMGISALVGAFFMPEKTVVSSPEYAQLQNLLAAENWEQADRRTYDLMLKAARREKEGYLDINSIETFPCTDLRKIDRLWVKYSDKRFGFSVQKGIWESVGGKPGEHQRETSNGIFQDFALRVGWRNGLRGEDTISLYVMPGHLPYTYTLEKDAEGRGYEWVSVFFSRVETCRV
jgi:hypothetical protein